MSGQGEDPRVAEKTEGLVAPMGMSRKFCTIAILVPLLTAWVHYAPIETRTTAWAQDASRCNGEPCSGRTSKTVLTDHELESFALMTFSDRSASDSSALYSGSQFPEDYLSRRSPIEKDPNLLTYRCKRVGQQECVFSHAEKDPTLLTNSPVTVSGAALSFPFPPLSVDLGLIQRRLEYRPFR